MVGVVSASMACVSMAYDVIASMVYVPKVCFVFASMVSVSRTDVVSLPIFVVSA